MNLYTRIQKLLHPHAQITDGFGETADRWCAHCGAEMVVIRPGDIRCGDECYLKQTITIPGDRLPIAIGDPPPLRRIRNILSRKGK